MKRSYTPRTAGVLQVLKEAGRPLWFQEIVASCRQADPTLAEDRINAVLARLVKSGEAVKPRWGLYCAQGVSMPEEVPRAVYRALRPSGRARSLSNAKVVRWDVLRHLVSHWNMEHTSATMRERDLALCEMAGITVSPEELNADHSYILKEWRRNLPFLHRADTEVRVLRHPQVAGEPQLHKELLFWFIVTRIGAAEEMIQHILRTAKTGPAEIVALMDQQKALCAARGWVYSDHTHRSVLSALISLLRRAGVDFLPRPCKGMVQIAPDCPELGIKTSAEYRKVVERLGGELVG